MTILTNFKMHFMPISNVPITLNGVTSFFFFAYHCFGEEEDCFHHYLKLECCIVTLLIKWTGEKSQENGLYFPWAFLPQASPLQMSVLVITSSGQTLKSGKGVFDWSVMQSALTGIMSFALVQSRSCCWCC